MILWGWFAYPQEKTNVDVMILKKADGPLACLTVRAVSQDSNINGRGIS